MGKGWRNWSGLVHSPSAEVVQPASRDELAQVLQAAARHGRGLRMVGAGHSFSPLVQTDGTIVSLDRLQGVIAVDQRDKTARVHAGTRLAALGDALALHGLAMENLGDINVQSIAGAVSTGTHGTGSGFGNIATQVTGFTLLTADGTELHASANVNPELFAAGRISLGALGVITELTLRLVPSYRLRLVRGRDTLAACLADADRRIAAHRAFEFYWLPHTETVLTKAWDTTDDPVDAMGLSRWVSDVLLENHAFGALCRLTRAVPAWCPPVSRFCASLVSPGTQVDPSHASLATVRRVRFNEMEWAVPAEHGAAALREIRALIERRDFPLLFPLEYRWVRGDDQWLSPNHGRDSVHISVHQFVGMPWERYFDGVQAICLAHGGRPHWGKMHGLTARELAPLYPHWDDFLALREKLDPKGLFLTPYLRRLLGV